MKIVLDLEEKKKVEPTNHKKFYVSTRYYLLIERIIVLKHDKLPPACCKLSSFDAY